MIEITTVLIVFVVTGLINTAVVCCWLNKLRIENAALRAFLEKTMWDVSLDHGDMRCRCCHREYPNHSDKCDLAKLLERTL